MQCEKWAFFQSAPTRAILLEYTLKNVIKTSYQILNYLLAEWPASYKTWLWGKKWLHLWIAMKTSWGECVLVHAVYVRHRYDNWLLPCLVEDNGHIIARLAFTPYNQLSATRSDLWSWTWKKGLFAYTMFFICKKKPLWGVYNHKRWTSFTFHRDMT